MAKPCRETHSLHYYQSGSYWGIRAIPNHQAAQTTLKRQVEVGVEFDQDTDKNWVVSTYWEGEELQLGDNQIFEYLPLCINLDPN